MAIVLCALLLLLAWHRTSSADPVSSPAPTAIQELSSIPLLFEVNVGQTDEQVRYLARPGLGVTYFFTERGHTVLLSEQRNSPAGPMRRSTDREVTEPPTRSHAVKVDFPGANPRPSVSVEGEAQGLTNYFLGRDPNQWRTHVPSYSVLHYSDLYDGIDLVYYGSGARLEYDFIVHPGADPSQNRSRDGRRRDLS